MDNTYLDFYKFWKNGRPTSGSLIDINSGMKAAVGRADSSLLRATASETIELY